VGVGTEIVHRLNQIIDLLTSNKQVRVELQKSDGTWEKWQSDDTGKGLVSDPVTQKKVDDVEDKLDDPDHGLAALETDLTTILTRIGDPTGHTLANIIAKLGNPALALGTILERLEIPKPFTSSESFDDIIAIGPTNTTEMTITVALPTGATIRSAILAAFITVVNDTANIQKIDIDVQGRVAAGAWNTYFSQNACIAVPAVDGSTTGFVPTQNVSALVTAAGNYGFRLAVTQSSANSVHYTVNYILIVVYRMG